MESFFCYISPISSLSIHSKIPIWCTYYLLFFSVITSLWLLLSTHTYLLDIFQTYSALRAPDILSAGIIKYTVNIN